MLRKQKKAQKGPSWFEVILGALLAVVLGVVLGVAYLATKTVNKVTSIPKDAPAGAIYYIEGAKDMNRLGVTEKRKSFVDGETVVVEEGELNALLASAPRSSSPAPAAAKPGDKAPAPAADAKMISTTTLNARIRDGKIQFGDTATISLFGVGTDFIVQATGTFEKSGSGFEFEPDSIYVGGCPVQRLLFIRSWILKKLLFTDPVPPDIAAAWSKLLDVSIDGSKLRLRAP
jgi:hypothetical protein